MFYATSHRFSPFFVVIKRINFGLSLSKTINLQKECYTTELCKNGLFLSLKQADFFMDKTKGLDKCFSELDDPRKERRSGRRNG
jgi:hypothetical protein